MIDNTCVIIITNEVYKLLYILAYEIDAKIECILYAGHIKRESNIWHNLGGNIIKLFIDINNEYMNKINY